jgi:hypothetical protein
MSNTASSTSRSTVANVRIASVASLREVITRS